MDMTTESPGTTIPQLAVEYKVSEAVLYGLARQGKLPGARRLGKQIIIHRTTFEEWIRSGQGE